MTVARDVDKFWQELNKKALPRKETGSSQRQQPVESQAKQAKVCCTVVDHCDPQQQSLATVDTSRQAASDCSQLDLDGIERRLQRDLQALKAHSASARCQALQHIRASTPAQQSTLFF